MVQFAMQPPNQFVITVLAPDRVGVLRDVTREVFQLGGNIDVIRQSIVNGFFSLTFTAVLPDGVTDATIRDRLCRGLGDGADLVVRAFAAQPPAVLPDGTRYIAMTCGADQPGTIFGISDFFVQHGINIEDWQVETTDQGVVYVAQVTIPAHADTSRLQETFRQRMTERGLLGSLVHENIFRATNEIGPIRALTKPALATRTPRT